MSRALKRILFIVGGAVGLLVLAALAVVLFVDVSRYKPRLESAASDALGMEVHIGGRLGIGAFPGFHLTAEDSQILGAPGVVVASAKRVSLWIEWLPLLEGNLRLHRIELKQPTLSIVRGPEGRFNVERLRKAVSLLGALDGASVSISDGALFFADRKSAEGFDATGCDLAVSRLRLAGGGKMQSLQRLSLKAELACGRIRTRDLMISTLKLTVIGKNGVLEMEPITMSIFGGRLTGAVHADFSADVPQCQIRCSLPDFRIEEFLKTLSPKKAVDGAMNFSADLSTRGESMRQMLESTAGNVSLRGEDLVLVDNDLDSRLSRFESSQNFNLVDVGAVFFAGPLGLAVTKGYNFASLFRGAGGSSRIGTLVSDWRVDHGVARATDVAMSTSKNRIALQGGLDFVNGRFEDVTVAVIDTRGCARVRQAIRGSFEKPTVEKPRVLMSLAGPVLKLYKRTRKLFPEVPCEPFYSGSVAVPG